MKKIICILISLVMATATFTGCRFLGGGGNDSNTLHVQIFQGGYGTDWLYEMADLYSETYPDWDVDIDVIYESSDAVDELKSGSSKVDLYFNKTEISKFVLKPTNIFGTTYETLLEDLTDIYNEPLPGENVTLKEKMDPYFVEVNKYTAEDGSEHYYATPWAVGTVGIVKNNKLWDDDWPVPVTTNELFEVLDTIKAETNTAPFIFSLEDSYWDLMYNVWFYQYDGLEAANNFFEGIAADGRKYVPEFLLYQGRYEALRVMERILDPDNGYVHEYSYSVNFTSAQNYFLEGSLNSPLTCNADWMNGELLLNYGADEVDLEMIKPPIVSSIVEKLSFWSETEEYADIGAEKQAKYDAALRSIVNYVDGKGEKPTVVEGMTITDADITRIAEARGIHVSASESHQGWIPIYAKNKDAAKKFLQLMATDKGIETFVKASQGYILPYNYDYTTLENEMSDYLKGVNREIAKVFADPDDSEEFMCSNREKDPLFALAGLSQYGNNGIGDFIKLMSAKNSADRKTADWLITQDYIGVAARWDNYLALAQ